MARPSSTNAATSVERRQKNLKAANYCWIDFLTNLTESICIDGIVPNIVCAEVPASYPATHSRGKHLHKHPRSQSQGWGDTPSPRKQRLGVNPHAAN